MDISPCCISKTDIAGYHGNITQSVTTPILSLLDR